MKGNREVINQLNVEQQISLLGANVLTPNHKYHLLLDYAAPYGFAPTTEHHGELLTRINQLFI